MTRRQRMLHETRYISVQERILAKSQYLWAGQSAAMLASMLRANWGLDGLTNATMYELNKIDQGLAWLIREQQAEEARK